MVWNCRILYPFFFLLKHVFVKFNMSSLYLELGSYKFILNGYLIYGCCKGISQAICKWSLLIMCCLYQVVSKPVASSTVIKLIV